MILEVIRKENEKQRREGRKEGRREGRKEGRQEGREEGRQEGRQEGRREGIKQVAIKMLKIGVKKDIICKATNMTKQEIDKLAEKIS